MPNDLTVVIQAGGKSSRMGESKPLLPFLGVPLIQRILEIVHPIAQEVIIVSNNHSELDFLQVAIVNDSIPDKGAIGGLYTAMDVSKNDYVAVVACDLPFVNPALLLAGLKLLKLSGSDVAIPRIKDDYYEPLHAVYRRDTCRSAIYQSINNNQRRLISWFPTVNVIEMDHAFCKQIDPEGHAFLNINTKEDFLHAESIARNNSKI